MGNRWNVKKSKGQPWEGLRGEGARFQPCHSQPCSARGSQALSQHLHRGKGRGWMGPLLQQHKEGFRALPTEAGWLPSLLPSPPSFWAISWRTSVTQSQSNGPTLEGCSENQHTEEKASLGSSGAQWMGPCWFQSTQGLYSGSANNGPFRGNEGTVNPEVMNKKKKHLFTQFASRKLHVI